MFQYTAAHRGSPNLILLIRHDDKEREYAYEDNAFNALKAAWKNNWTVVSMKKDFKKIFQFK